MLRKVLTLLSVMFFVVVNLLLVVLGKGEARWAGVGSVAFFGVLGSLGLLGILRKQRGRVEQKSSQAVTREEMLASVELMHGQLQCLSPFYFDMRGPGEPPDVLLNEWVQRRKPEQFGAFLEVVAHPPPGADELWQDSMAQILTAWVAHNPNLFSELGSVAGAEAARPVFLQAFADLAGRVSVGGVPECRERIALWLTGWREESGKLSEMEQAWLEEAATFCAPAC